MARSVSMGTLVARTQRRSKKEKDDSVMPAEWKELISELYGEAHGLVAETGCRYFETEATITANGGASYPLPSDHLASVGVDFVVDATTDRRFELDELQTTERTFVSGLTGDARLWAFTGTSVALFPKPSSGTYKHLYVPQPTDLSLAADATTVDLMCIHGEAFVLWGVAAIALHKSDDDQRRAIDERDKSRERLLEWATERLLTVAKRRVVTSVGDLRGMDPADWRWPR